MKKEILSGEYRSFINHRGWLKFEDMDAQELDQLKFCYLGTGEAFSVQHKILAVTLINIRQINGRVN